MTEQKLRQLSRVVSSTRKVAKIVGVCAQTVWLWQKGVARFNAKRLKKLELALVSELNRQQALLARFSGPESDSTIANDTR
jgi:DNA-binding transcriptional regulator YdaS (Cro superfamily)